MNFLYLFLGTLHWDALIMSMFSMLTLHLKVIQYTELGKKILIFWAKRNCTWVLLYILIVLNVKTTGNKSIGKFTATAALDCLWTKRCEEVRAFPFRFGVLATVFRISQGHTNGKVGKEVSDCLAVPAIHLVLVINNRSGHNCIRNWTNTHERQNCSWLTVSTTFLYFISLDAHVNPEERGYRASANEESGNWTNEVIDCKVSCAILKLVAQVKS